MCGDRKQDPAELLWAKMSRCVSVSVQVCTEWEHYNTGSKILEEQSISAGSTGTPIHPLQRHKEKKNGSFLDTLLGDRQVM